MNSTKEPKMRDGIKKRGDSYIIYISLGKDPDTGKYRSHYETVRGTREDAKNRRAELLTQLNTGMFVKPSKLSLAEYLDRWLKEYVYTNLAPRTAEGYELIARRHVIPALGRITLTDLKPVHIQNYQSQKLTSGRADGKGGLNPRTVRHHYMMLHTALREAVKLGLLSRNIMDGVTPPSCTRHEWQHLSESDLNRFLELAKPSPYYSLFYLALFTGMRRSELLALRWRDVNLVLCEAYVSRSLHHLQTGETVIRPPKSKHGLRTVDLPLSAALLLQEHKDRQEAHQLMRGSKLSDNDLVFTDVMGKPLLPNTVTHAWIKLVRKAGLQGVRLHDCRHTHASLMLQQGVHPKVVQERLGHASIQMTIDTYSHVSRGIQKAAAEGFDRLLTQNQGAIYYDEPVATNS